MGSVKSAKSIIDWSVSAKSGCNLWPHLTSADLCHTWLAWTDPCSFPLTFQHQAAPLWPITVACLLQIKRLATNSDETWMMIPIYMIHKMPLKTFHIQFGAKVWGHIENLGLSFSFKDEIFRVLNISKYETLWWNMNNKYLWFYIISRSLNLIL